MYISVVTPSYNQGRYISDCINSILTQDYDDFEHIIVDNCSVDETNFILSRNDHLKIIQEKDNGQSHALNKGYSAAEGDIICWLNSDDMLHEGVFYKLKNIFSDLSVDIIYCDSLVYDEIKNKKYTNKAFIKNLEDFKYWWRGNIRIHQPSVFFRKSVYERIGNFREDLHYIMDYEYWYRAIQIYPFKKIDEIFSIQRIHKEAKTYKWHKFYEEKEKVYGKFCNNKKLLYEKRKKMSENYFWLGVSISEMDKKYALQMLFRAFKCSPSLFIRNIVKTKGNL